jgi:hypothetical protein
VPESPITFRLPEDYRLAFEAAAAKAGVPLGTWIRDAAAAALPKTVRKKLAEPRKRGRPKKAP